MADTLLNLVTNDEITKDIIKTSRTSSLNQVVNIGLNGLAHIQNIGKVTFQVQVELVIHESKDSLLYRAFENANLMKVVDDGRTYQGYIISVELGDVYAEGYHTGMILIQEEVVV